MDCTDSIKLLISKESRLVHVDRLGGSVGYKFELSERKDGVSASAAV
jgi:hypothetical protein